VGKEAHVGSTSLIAPTAAELHDHWLWRPEWTPDRTCLYWYLTFDPDEIARAVGDAALESAHRTSWLDAVPPQWCHVTVADVGFTDELEQSDVEDVTAAVAEAVSGEEGLRLTLGPVQTYRSALVLAAGPLEGLRAVKDKVRRATSATLGPRHTDFHRQLFWPHLSLGYVNRAVDARTAADLARSVPPVAARVDVHAVTLAAVSRRDHRYQWQVQAQVDLLGGASRATG
jgi:2'-5' RNA ligase